MLGLVLSLCTSSKSRKRIHVNQKQAAKITKIRTHKSLMAGIVVLLMLTDLSLCDPGKVLVQYFTPPICRDGLL